MISNPKHIEQLLLLCKANNQSAQLEIYKRYNNAMYNTAHRILKDTCAAEDVIQESFLIAFTKLHTLKNISVFGAWLKRIVVNNAMLHYNKTTAKKEVPLEGVLYKIDTFVDWEYTNQNTSQVREIMRLMTTLKPNYSLCLSLHFIEGYDYDEICDIMNISYANCRTLISRAKASLRKKLLPTV